VCLIGSFLKVLSFSFRSCPCGSINVLRVLFCVLVDIFKFLLRKKE